MGLVDPIKILEQKLSGTEILDLFRKLVVGLPPGSDLIEIERLQTFNDLLVMRRVILGGNIGHD